MEEEILNEIDKINTQENPNEIIEIDENEEINTTQYDVKDIREEVKKKSNKGKWTKLPKNQKIIVIVCIVLLVLSLIGIIVYFLLSDKKEDIDDAPKKDEPLVIVEKDNYRYEDGKLIFINADKKEIGSYECDNTNETLCYVAYYSNEDEFDIPNKIYEDGIKINNRSDIIGKYAFVYDNDKKEGGKVTLYNFSTKKVEGTYDLVKEFDSTKVIVKENKKYKLLSLEEGVNDILEESFDYLGFIPEKEYLIAGNSNNYKLLEVSGEDASVSLPGKIQNYAEYAISVKNNNKYYIYNYEGEKIVNSSYDFVSFIDEYIIAATGKSLYVFDYEGNKMNGEGVPISTSSYETNLIFSEELIQTGKEEPFSAYVVGNNLRIESSEKITTINLDEGKFNKDLEYVNYFSKVLYFYSDKEKNNLIGTYACKNENTINDTTEILNNCFIAKETNKLEYYNNDVKNGYLPIYNNRYVFISDVKDSNNDKTIILYDLKNKSTLATYLEVDASFHDTTSLVNAVSVSSTLAVVKSATDGAYGVINITTSGIKGIISFRDESVNVKNTDIRMHNNYFIITRSDETEHLYDKTGKEITKNITTKYVIDAYDGGDYIITKRTTQDYYLYSLSGKVIKGNLKYVDTFNDNKHFIAVTSDNKVGIYTYNNPENNLINEDFFVEDADKEIIISVTLKEDNNVEVKYKSKTITVEMN